MTTSDDSRGTESSSSKTTVIALTSLLPADRSPPPVIFAVDEAKARAFIDASRSAAMQNGLIVLLSASEFDCIRDRAEQTCRTPEKEGEAPALAVHLWDGKKPRSAALNARLSKELLRSAEKCLAESSELKKSSLNVFRPILSLPD